MASGKRILESLENSLSNKEFREGTLDFPKKFTRISDTKEHE